MLGLTLHACVHSLAWQRLGWRDVLPVGWLSIFARRGAYRGCGRAVPVLALTLLLLPALALALLPALMPAAPSRSGATTVLTQSGH